MLAGVGWAQAHRDNYGGGMRPFSGTLPAAAAPRLRDRLHLTADGPLQVLHTGPHAVYLAVDRPGSAPWCVGIVGSRATALPNALRVALPDLRSLDLTAVCVLDGRLQAGSIAIRVARIVDVQVPPLTGTPAPASGPAGVDRLVAGIGLGGGLTPYGDDVLCGWLGFQRAAGRATPDADAAIRAALPRTTLLSATLLDCALRGEVLPEFAAYVAALGTPDESLREAAVAAIGATSGQGLLEGVRLARTGRGERAA